MAQGWKYLSENKVLFRFLDHLFKITVKISLQALIWYRYSYCELVTFLEIQIYLHTFFKIVLFRSCDPIILPEKKWSNLIPD